MAYPAPEEPRQSADSGTVMMEAAIMIAVFLEDSTSYDQAMTKFLARVPAYIYLTSDGDLPVAPTGSSYTTSEELIAYWYGQTTFVNGISQETCRDLEHTGYGVASISHVAETSRIQGRDLFVEETGTRLRYALGFHSNYALGAAVPSWLCGGTLTGKFLNGRESVFWPTFTPVFTLVISPVSASVKQLTHLS